LETEIFEYQNGDLITSNEWGRRGTEIRIVWFIRCFREIAKSGY